MTFDGIYLRTNPVTETLNALEMAKNFLNLNDSNYYNLKWALLSTHTALQNMFVLSIRGSTNWEVIDHECSKSRSQENVLSNPYPHLKDFMTLFSDVDVQYSLVKNIPIDNTPKRIHYFDLPKNGKNKSFNRYTIIYSDAIIYHYTGKIEYIKPISKDPSNLEGGLLKGNNAVIEIKQKTDETNGSYIYATMKHVCKSENISLLTFIKRLNEDRNEFIHYIPKEWSIEVNRITELIFYAMKTIDFLRINAHCLVRDFLDDDMGKLNKLIIDIFEILETKY